MTNSRSKDECTDNSLNEIVPEQLIIKEYRERVRYKVILMGILLLLLVVSMTAAISTGAVNIPIKEVFLAVASCFYPNWDFVDDKFSTVVCNIRLPRVLMGMVAGMGLGVSGAIMQSVLRNPMASPFTLGVSSGAGLGAALAIIFAVGLGFSGNYIIVINAFVFAIMVSFIILGVARVKGTTPQSLVLAGIALMHFFSALTTLFTYFADVYATREIMFWMVGSLGKADWEGFWWMFTVFALIFPYLWAKSGDLNRLSMGDEVAKSLGVSVKSTRVNLMSGVSLLVASIISFTGNIGFVGLVVPHLVRILIGSDNRYVIPASALMGGLLLVTADAIALNIIDPIVLPVGVITSFIGSPLFVYLILRERKGMA